MARLLFFTLTMLLLDIQTTRAEVDPPRVCNTIAPTLVKVGLATPARILRAAQAPGPHRACAMVALTELCGPEPSRVLAALILSPDIRIALQALDAAAMSFPDAVIDRALATRLRDRKSPAVVRMQAYERLLDHDAHSPLAHAYDGEIARLKLSPPVWPDVETCDLGE